MRHRGVETKCTLYPCSAGVIHTYAARTYVWLADYAGHVLSSKRTVLGGGMGGANPAPVAEVHGP